jgi:catechol 2,3-dioxygenase-like lactoylglutathione lyase family enzyme
MNATAPAANHSVILDFEVADVDRERSRLAPLVDTFVLEPTNQPWGNRSMLFRDPDGNLINFFAPIDRAARA